MSYHLQITTDADAGLVTLNINGTEIEIVEADIPRWALASLPPQIDVQGHHVQADDRGVEWVRTLVRREGMTRDNGEGKPFTQLYTTVLSAQAGDVTYDRKSLTMPETDPGHKPARDMTPEEIAALAAEVRADWQAKQPGTFDDATEFATDAAQ